MVRRERATAGRSPAARSPERRNLESRERILHEIVREFDEFPAMRLTAAQVRRLFTLRPDVCQRVLTALCSDRLLDVGRDGRYGRRDR
jgi:hypothetical protein